MIDAILAATLIVAAFGIGGFMGDAAGYARGKRHAKRELVPRIAKLEAAILTAVRRPE